MCSYYYLYEGNTRTSFEPPPTHGHKFIILRLPRRAINNYLRESVGETLRISAPTEFSSPVVVH